MSAGRPVARLVAPVITRVTALVLLMGGIAVAGVIASTVAVNELTDDLQPAAAANKDVLQDLSDMQAAVRVWGEGLRPLLAAEGVGVSVICPGFVISRMTQGNAFPMPFLMDSDRDRDRWEIRGPLCESWPIFHAVGDADSGMLYAAAASE